MHKYSSTAVKLLLIEYCVGHCQVFILLLKFAGSLVEKKYLTLQNVFSYRYVQYISCTSSIAIIFQTQQACFREWRVGENGGFKKGKIQYI